MSTKKLQIIGNLVEVDTTLTQSEQAADAKTVGDAINKANQDIAQKTQVQVITWGADD